MHNIHYFLVFSGTSMHTVREHQWTSKWIPNFKRKSMWRNTEWCNTITTSNCYKLIITFSQTLWTFCINTVLVSASFSIICVEFDTTFDLSHAAMFFCISCLRSVYILLFYVFICLSAFRSTNGLANKLNITQYGNKLLSEDTLWAVTRQQCKQTVMSAKLYSASWAPKCTPGDAKCATEILGEGRNKEVRVDDIML